MHKLKPILIIGILILIIASISIIFLANNKNDIPSKIQETTGETQNKVIKVACVGDSITEGYSGSNYPSFLKTLLGKEYEISNFGVGGTTAMSDGSYPYTSTSAYRNSLKFDADIVVLMFGTNDSNVNSWQGKSIFKKQYEELVNTYQNLATKPKVYLCTPASAYYTEGKNTGVMRYGIQGNFYEEIITAIKEVADERNLEIIDINSLTANHKEWYNTDGIHPNKNGAEAIAQEVYKKIGGSK